MNSKYFLNLEKIISINFEKQSPTKYKWFDETIKTSWLVKKTTTPAGWKYNGKGSITPSELFKKYDQYILDDINKIIYDKAQVEFIMEDDVKLYEWFNSDEEALKFIEDLIQKTGKTYQEFDKK